MFGELDHSRYEYFGDNHLCFGLSCAPAIFNRLSNATVRMMSRRGFKAIVNYYVGCPKGHTVSKNR